jgi:cytochrome c oxidase subunit 3
LLHRKQFYPRAESEARLSQAHYVVEGANLETNTVVNYLLISFSLDFTDFHVSLGNDIISFQCINWNLERKSYEMVESWSLLALSDLGFVFTVFLSSLIFKNNYHVTRTRI